MNHSEESKPEPKVNSVPPTLDWLGEECDHCDEWIKFEDLIESTLCHSIRNALQNQPMKINFQQIEPDKAKRKSFLELLSRNSGFENHQIII